MSARLPASLTALVPILSLCSACSSSPGATLDRAQERAEPLTVVLLTTEELYARHAEWTALLGRAGHRVAVDHAHAFASPTQEELQSLARRFDVAVLPHDVPVEAYASPEWNRLPIGLVSLAAEAARRDRWHWLEIDEPPIPLQEAAMKVADAHTILYGLTVGERGLLRLFRSAESSVLRGFVRAGDEAQLGIVALDLELESGDVHQQLVAWEPGPFFRGSSEEAAARRVLFGLDPTASGLLQHLTEEARQVFVRAVEWAALPGEPRRPEATFEPEGLLLTWQRDPTRTMTIDWHTLPSDSRTSELRFRSEKEFSWLVSHGRTKPFPHSDRLLHRVELSGLRPDTVYLFNFGEDSRVYRFRTLPTDAERPLTFIAGGDVRHSWAMMERTSREALRHNPAFLAWGGDLAYADGRPENFHRWHDFFTVIRNSLITTEGRVVPVIAGIGNHEVAGGYHHAHPDYRQDDESRARIAPFFYELFAFPGQPGYAVLDVGDYMSWILLDTGHTNPIEGAQTAWLAAVLEARRNVPHVFPLYHVPAFPSFRSASGRESTLVREHFVPLFESGPVRVAFENHDHAYKRTHPIRDGEVAADGVVYLGDGAWGVNTREAASPGERWYLAETESVRHFMVGTVHRNAQRFRAFDEHGHLIDAIER